MTTEITRSVNPAPLQALHNAPSTAAEESSAPQRKTAKLPLDVMLNLVPTDTSVLRSLVYSFPDCRTSILQPRMLRPALLGEQYPHWMLPDPYAANARADYLRALQAHVTVEKFVPAQLAGACPPGRIAPAYVFPSPQRTAYESKTSTIAGNTIFQTQQIMTDGEQQTRVAYFSLGRNQPTWQEVLLPPNWDRPTFAKNGSWAIICGPWVGEGNKFRLFSLVEIDPIICFEGICCSTLPQFSTDSRNVLYTDTHKGKVRINRLELFDGQVKRVSTSTTYEVNEDGYAVHFSPLGRKVLIGDFEDNHASMVYDTYNSDAATVLAAGSVDDEYKEILWGKGEQKLIFFYSDDKRAAAYTLDRPFAQKLAFQSSFGDELKVEACHEDHLLTVRPEAGQEAWQLLSWQGEAVSKIVYLPLGNRSHEDISKLVSWRATLAFDRPNFFASGEPLLVDFSALAAPTSRLRGELSYSLAEESNLSSSWLVSPPLSWSSPASGEVNYFMAAVAADGSADDTLVRVPATFEDAYQIRPDGKAMLVANPTDGISVYRLKESKDG